MNLGPFVDVAIGVMSIMILFSLAASAIQEVIGEMLRQRPRTLEEGVRSLLASRHMREFESRLGVEGATPKAAEDRVVSAFYDAPPIRALMHRGRKPSAIPPRVYAETVLDLLGRRDELEARAKAETRAIAARAEEMLAAAGAALGEGAADTAAALTREARELGDRAERGIGEARRELDAAIGALESEFNDTMDRVSGWYARKTKTRLFLIGLFLAGGANLDVPDYALSVIARTELQDRAAAYGQMLTATSSAGAGAGRVGTADAEADAARTTEGGPSPAAAQPEGLDQLAVENLESLVRELNQLGISAGWRCRPEDDLRREDVRFVPWVTCGEEEALAVPTVTAVMGWLLIALGTTLGAQFWYQLMRQAVALRTSGLLSGGGSRGS